VYFREEGIVNRLKLWRLQEGLTQADAAKRLGIGESSLAVLESGRLRPTTGQLARLRAAFGEQTVSLFDQVHDRVDISS
jgi:transcriptional regulator with XRE-family HTH domain